MALNIKNSTIGVDADGLKTALDKIHTDVIEEAENAMNEFDKKIETEIKDCWVGKGADIFVKNVQNDNKLIKGALKQLEDGLESELSQIIRKMIEAEEATVEGR